MNNPLIAPISYLGETLFTVSESPFAEYTVADWALYYIERYGQIDGEHHKLWVLDQVARILKGTPLIIKQAAWSDGQTEWRISTGEPSPQYEDWAREQLGAWDEENEEYEYWYDEGTAP